MANRDTLFNATTSVLGFLVTTGVMLVVYRLCAARLGMEFIGLWAVLSAITTIGGIGTLGLGGGMLKFFAEARSTGTMDCLPGVLNGVLWRMAVITSGFLVLLYVIARWSLPSFVSPERLDEALRLLPFALVVFWISTLAQLVFSAIEGLNKGWHKNTMAIAGQLLLLALVWKWIETHGLLGLLLAQLVQALFLLMASFVTLRWNLPSYQIRFGGEDREHIRQVMTYGIKFQAQNVLQMLGDPVTKLFLSRYGGLSIVGYFEVSTRLILQVRQLIMSALQGLLPRMVEVCVSGSKARIADAFNRVNRVNADIFVVAFGGIFIFCPFLFEVWLGQNEPLISHYCRWLIVPWLVNAFAIVPYMFNLSTGRMEANIISHALMAGLNLLLGLLVILFDMSSTWFIVSWGISLLAGSLYLIIAARESEGWLKKVLVEPGHLRIWMAVGLSGLLATMMQSLFPLSATAAAGVSIVAFFAITGYAWFRSGSYLYLRTLFLELMAQSKVGNNAQDV